MMTNKRAVVGLIALTLLGWKVKADSNDYFFKVTTVSQSQDEVTAKFTVVPRDMRIVCKGDISGLSEGDYVKLDHKNGEFMLKSAKCNEVRWLQ